MTRPSTNSGRKWRLQGAHALVFVASFSLMVIEVIAGRIMAPYLGMSVYTWTSIIGTVLAGIALGNFVGGILAERGAGMATVGKAFVGAGFAATAAFFTFAPVTQFILDFAIPYPLATLAFAAFGFFPVSFLLSIITPIVVANAIPTLEKAGTTVGGIYAISAVASLIGTFTAGFVLISLLGVKYIILITGASLILVGILASRTTLAEGSSTRRLVVIALFMLWTGLLVPRFCMTETAYYCIYIEPVSSGRGEGIRLVLDRLTHSYSFDDPTALEYGYENIYAIAAEYVHARNGGSIDAMFIGGGGYTMPRYLHHHYPGSALDVAEIDPGVTRVAEDYFRLERGGPVRTINEDARMFLAYGAEDRTYDIVFGDAFNDYSVPTHLTTREFFAIVRDHLRPGGLYALNIIDDQKSGRLLSSFVVTAKEVFPHVEIAPLKTGWEEGGRNTFVIISSMEPIDRTAWLSAAGRAYGQRIASPPSTPFDEASMLLDPGDTERHVREKRGVVLTDDYAPVDILAAPIFIQAL